MACISPLLSYQSSNPRDRFVETCVPGDEQGIPFNSNDIPFSRSVLRKRRLGGYQPIATTLANPLNSAATNRADFYRFEGNYSKAQARQDHFQLRHCLKVKSDNKLYFTGPGEGEISIFDPLTQTNQLVLSLSPAERMKIAAFDVAYPLIATGGMHSELYLDSMAGDVKVRHHFGNPANGEITNSVDFVDFKGSLELMIGSNGKVVSFYDPNILTTPKRELHAGENVNRVVLSTDQTLIAFVSDECPGRVISSTTMREVYVLNGHTDFGFGLDWHPTNPYQLVTGNQDRTYRIWDIRVADNSDVRPMVTLFGRMASVLSTHFSQDGELLVAAEAADFVHVVDAKLYAEEQEIDFFGEVTGVAFSKEDVRGESLYIGIHDDRFASIMEMRRRRHWSDSVVV